MIELVNQTEDIRQTGKIKHQLGDIVMIVLICTLADIEEWEDMEDFAIHHEDVLRKYLNLENGIPSHDTINRVMSMINPNELNTLLQKWNELVLEGKELGKLREIFSIDGKTMRGNKNKNQQANHVVSAYSNNHGLCFGQVLTQEKSNEITAIPELLKKLKLNKSVVTIDAMGTQASIAEKIVASKADYVFALKGNQKAIYEPVKEYFEDEEFLNKIRDTDGYKKTIEQVRGQVETREYFQTSDIKWIDERSKWKKLKTIGMVKKTIEKDDKIVIENRHYINSVEIEIDLFERAVRGHWGVEVMHWHLDVTFKEDANSTLDKNAAMNMNIIRKISLGILKELDTGKKLSLRKKRRRIGWDLEKFIEAIFTI